MAEESSEVHAGKAQAAASDLKVLVVDIVPFASGFINFLNGERFGAGVKMLVGLGIIVVLLAACAGPAGVPQPSQAPASSAQPLVRKLVFNMPDMDRRMCEHFPTVVISTLEGIDGVLDAGFEYEGHVVTVYYDATRVSRDRLLNDEAYAWIGTRFLREDKVEGQSAEDILVRREQNNALVMPPAHMADLPAPDKGYADASAADFKRLADDPSVFVLDVHIPEQAHLPGTDAFIPFNDMSAHRGRLPRDKDTPIAVYCRSGSMSRDAAKELADMGFTNITNLIGGVQEWTMAGYAVEESKARCCRECRAAFSQSPVAVGEEGARCGGFTTGAPLTAFCEDYFAANPATVAECQ